MTQTPETTQQTQEQPDLWTKIQTVNSLLQAQEPANISVDTFSKATGYDFQSIKNAMNEVFTPNGWGYDEISHEIFNDGPKPNLVVTEVEVWIRGVERRVKAWGQCNITRGAIGDALKGGKTDAAKKGLSDYSIGDRAYLGLLSMVDAEEYAARQKTLDEQKQIDARNRARDNQNGNAQTTARQQERAATQRQERPQTAATDRPAQAASAAPATRPTPARMERPQTAPAAATNAINKAPVPDGVGTMSQLVKRFTNLDVRVKGKRVEWVAFMEHYLKEELEAKTVTIQALLDINALIPIAMRLKLDSAMNAIEEQRASAARA